MKQEDQHSLRSVIVYIVSETPSQKPKWLGVRYREADLYEFQNSQRDTV